MNFNFWTFIGYCLLGYASIYILLFIIIIIELLWYHNK